MSKEQIGKLIHAALDARSRAYVPYSHYAVGAALLGRDGKVYTGVNVENASYGATNCAERSAFFGAVEKGVREFEAIAIAGGMEGKAPVEYAYPCGICRQVMKEFCGKDFQVIVAKSENEYQIFDLNELLPHSFGGGSIC
ncbi:MAG: cytidine deaminase [Acetatifactor sp.]|nr:cytidine deaminase [Acetatifactor sp.]